MSNLEREQALLAEMIRLGIPTEKCNLPADGGTCNYCGLGKTWKKQVLNPKSNKKMPGHLCAGFFIGECPKFNPISKHLFDESTQVFLKPKTVAIEPTGFDDPLYVPPIKGTEYQRDEERKGSSTGKVQLIFSRTMQVQQYEPFTWSAMAERELAPNETIESGLSFVATQLTISMMNIELDVMQALARKGPAFFETLSQIQDSKSVEK